MGTQTNYEFRGEQDMNIQKELNDDEVRVIKISKEALFEFIYEKFIDDQDLYLDVDPLDVTNAFDINFERGEFIFCAYKSEDPHGRIVVLPSDIDLQQARMITRTVAANHTVETMSLLHTCWWMLTGRVIMT